MPKSSILNFLISVRIYLKVYLVFFKTRNEPKMQIIENSYYYNLSNISKVMILCLQFIARVVTIILIRNIIFQDICIGINSLNSIK